MKSLLAIVFLIVLSESPVLIKGKCFKGYIFPKEYNNKYFHRDTNNLFTPTEDEIIETEKLLLLKSRDIKNKKISTLNRCWNYNNLKKYNRQYFGEMDEKGNKVIFINFILKKSTPDYWYKDVVIVLDDNCESIWNDKIVLTPTN